MPPASTATVKKEAFNVGHALAFATEFDKQFDTKFKEQHDKQFDTKFDVQFKKQTNEGALTSIENTLQTAMNLTKKGSNDTTTQQIQKEITSLKTDIKKAAGQSDFNTQILLSNENFNNVFKIGTSIGQSGITIGALGAGTFTLLTTAARGVISRTSAHASRSPSPLARAQTIAARRAAMDPACDPVFDEGFNIGFNSGFNSGFKSGFQAGFDKGFNTGYNSGFNSGFKSGFQAGFDASHTFFENALNSGIKAGIKTAH